MNITETPEWAALEKHYAEISGRHLRELFAEDPGRAQSLTVQAADLFLDYSKNRITAETIRLLVASRSGPACASASTRCSAASTST